MLRTWESSELYVQYKNRRSTYLTKYVAGEHKARHYHEVGPAGGSHPMVVLGYFKVVGPPKRQKKRRKRKAKKETRGERRSKTIIQHLLSISAQLIYSTQANSNFLSTKC